MGYRRLIRFMVGLMILVAGTGDLRAAPPVGGPVSLIAWQSHPEGERQAVLEFKDARALFVLNSTFLDVPACEARIGSFEARIEPRLALLRKELDRLTNRISEGAGPLRNEIAAVPPSVPKPGLARVAVGGKELIQETPSYERMADVLRSLRSGSSWRPVDAVRVFLDSATRSPRVERLPKGRKTAVPSITCRMQGRDGYACQVKGYGFVTLECRQDNKK